MDKPVESKRKIVLTITNDFGVDGISRTQVTAQAFDNGGNEPSPATVHEILGMMREYELTTMIDIRLKAMHKEG